MSLTYNQQIYFRRSIGDLGSPEAPGNWQSDTFIGDGSTTVFALAHAPDQTNFSPVVLVNNKMQDSTGFSISGSTLTMTVALSSFNTIEVNYQY